MDRSSPATAEPLLSEAAEPQLSEKSSELKDDTGEKPVIQLTFLLLGAASSVTLTTVCLAAAYFKATLGAGVVGALITAQCSCNLVVMLVILVAMPAQLSLAKSVALITMSILYAVAFNIFLLVKVAYDTPIGGPTLYSLTALNGAATGTMQIIAARMGGDLPMTAKLGSLQLVGQSAAQWLPGMVQVCLLPLAVQPGKTHVAAGIGALLSIAASGSVCLAALVALQVMLVRAGQDGDDAHEGGAHPYNGEQSPPKHSKGGQTLWKRKQYKIRSLIALQGKNTIGNALRQEGGLHFVWNERVLVLAPALLLVFSCEALYTFMVVITTRLPVADSGAATSFWKTYQGTLLLLCANTFSFAGRSVGLRARPYNGLNLGVLCWWSLTPLAMTATLIYWLLKLPTPSNIYPLLLYTAAAFINGFSLVIINRSAQTGLANKLYLDEAHGSRRRDIFWEPCRIAAQLMWFALQLGAFVPALLSNLIT